MTTSDVTEQIIKPATASGAAATWILYGCAARRRGRSALLISHRWGCRFREQLLAPLLQRFEGEDPAGVFVWLDIFAVNQAWKTSEHHGASGLQLLAHGFEFSQVQDTFIDLDVAKAEATVAADRERIMADIDASMGAAALNMYLKNALIDSATAEAQQQLALLEAQSGDGDSDGAAAVRRAAAAAAACDKAGRLLQFAARLPAAEPYLRRALELNPKGDDASVEDSIMLGARLNNLGMLLKAQGKFEEAEALYREALQSSGAALVGAGAASIHNNLGMLLKDQGRLEEAEAEIRQAAILWEEALGPDCDSVAAALNNLGLVLCQQGNMEAAEPVLRRALELRQGALGPAHPDVAQSLNNLAALLKNDGRLTAAEPLYRQALAIDEQVYGGEHPAVGGDLNNLAMLMLAMRRRSEGLPYAERALTIMRATRGEDHPYTQHLEKLVDMLDV